MIDPELKSYLTSIDQRLEVIQLKKEGLWRSFFRGIVGAFGYIAGLLIALAILGFILNAIGVIPAFREQAKQWQQALEEIRKLR